MAGNLERGLLRPPPPDFGRYMPRQSEKWARAPERAPGRAWKCRAPERAWAVLSWKMRGSGQSLSRFEHENAGLRNELDPFWAWKCRESPELPGRVWLALWPAANPRRCRTPAFGLSRPWEAMNGLKLKKFWKWWSGTAKSAKKCKMVMLRNVFFFVICENDMLRNENSGLKEGDGGLSRGTYLICIHMEVPPPPPPGGGGGAPLYCRQCHNSSPVAI